MIQYESAQLLRSVAAQIEAIAASEITSFDVRQLEAAAEILANVASRSRGRASDSLDKDDRERLVAALRDGAPLRSCSAASGTDSDSGRTRTGPTMTSAKS